VRILTGMVNFFSIDDGLSYLAVRQISSITSESRAGHSFTVITLLDGTRLDTHRPIREVAEALGSVNLWK
jgi:hypothetical protein